MKIDLEAKGTRFFLFVVALFLAVAGISVLGKELFRWKPSGQETPFPKETQISEEVPQCDLIFDFGGGKIATYSAVRSSKGTVLDLLLLAAKKNQFEVDYEESEMGAWIKGISGVENTKDQFWMFWVNGKMAEKAADKQEIKDGDEVEFKFTEM